MTDAPPAHLPLTVIPAGETVTLAELGDAIPVLLRGQLAAYGLMPDRPLAVLQQRPMTLILIDELELALEADVSRHLWVIRGANENGS